MARPPSQPHERSGYLAQDTIAAIGTATGGALSMIRISGPRSFELLSKLTGREADRRAEERKLVRAPLHDSEGAPLDDALFARFVSPESYTGEDVVELHVHGGTFLAARLMETLRSLGARQALPGEFSFRAVRNGKMTVAQAQAVADLIGASNDGAIGLALEKMSGTQNRLLDDLATGLRQLAVLGEAGIDFADQDIEEVSLPRLKTRLAALCATLDRLEASYGRGYRLQEGVSVAFVGLPNAGKSSFFNALLGEERSIVSEHAGTTRDVIRERITLRGTQATVTLRFEDTAGLRLSDNPVERLGVERTLRASREADLVLFLVDPASPSPEVRVQWALVGSPGAKTIGIFTKRDLYGASQLGPLRATYGDLGVRAWVETSAETGEGLVQAIEEITAFCAGWTRRDQGEVLLTRLDQLSCVEAALEHLRRASQASAIELFAADLRQALHALGPLIGETLPDDILGKIFSEFCIGK